MKTTLLLLAGTFVALAAVATNAATAVDPVSDELNTPFSVKWQTSPYGPYQVFQGGTGLGGFESLVCAPSTNRTLLLPWSTVQYTKVRKAFLIWQAETDATPVEYELKLQGRQIMARANTIRSGTECNHLTGSKSIVLKRSDVYYADVTEDVKPRLDNKVGDVLFDIEFLSPCRVHEIANGVSLIVVGRNDVYFTKGTVVKIQIGAVAYDKNRAHHSPVVFSFPLPPTGTSFGERLDDAQLQIGLVVGEGENQTNERPEGYTINDGPFVSLAIDGEDGTRPEDGPKWDTKEITVSDCDTLTPAQRAKSACISDNDLALNISFQSQKDCLIFVALVLEYRVNYDEVDISIADYPRVRSWDGVQVAITTEGDHVLVSSDSTGLAVQARFSKNRRSPWTPFTTSLSEVIAFLAAATDMTAIALRCATDSGEVQFTADDFANPMTSGTGFQLTQVSARRYEVACEQTGLVVTLMLFHLYRVSYLNACFRTTASIPADLRGLLGTPNGDPLDDFASRHSRRIVLHRNTGTGLNALQEKQVESAYFASRHRRRTVHQRKSRGRLTALQQREIQSAWRVPDSDRLFHTVFQPTEFPNGLSWAAQIRMSRLSRRAAQTECVKLGVIETAALITCIEDAMLTGSAVESANVAEWAALVASLGAAGGVGVDANVRLAAMASQSSADDFDTK